MGWKDRLLIKLMSNKLVIKIMSVPVVVKMLINVTQALSWVASRFSRKKTETKASQHKPQP